MILSRSYDSRVEFSTQGFVFRAAIHLENRPVADFRFTAISLMMQNDNRPAFVLNRLQAQSHEPLLEANV